MRSDLQEALENLRQIIQRDVRIALNDLDRVWQQIAATRVTRMHQEKSVKAEQERFAVGASTGLLVAQAQRDLLATHIRETEVIIDYKKALVRLYLAEGSLLERSGKQLSINKIAKILSISPDTSKRYLSYFESNQNSIHNSMRNRKSCFPNILQIKRW